MLLSSSGCGCAVVGPVGLAGAQQCVQDVDAASGQRDVRCRNFLGQ